MMPIVRISGWPRGASPSITPVDLPRFLAESAGMDRAEVADAIGKLMKGKSVDAYFDLGENAAAKVFIRGVRRFGLESQFYDDTSNAWYGDRPRPWFVKYALTGLLVSLLSWIAFNWIWPGRIASRITTLVLLGFAISVPVLAGTRREPKSEEVLRRKRTLELWLRFGLPVFVALVVGLIQEPWLGVVLGLMALGGIGCFFVIRTINRNT